MQIVIDIPKYVVGLCCEDNVTAPVDIATLIHAVKVGIPLPEGHGRLIDADVLVDGMEDDYEFCEAVNATPTIIEAERSKE